MAPSLAEHDRKELAMAFASRIPSLSNPAVLHSFASVLHAASIELSAEQRHQISAHIVSLLKEPSTAPGHLPTLSETLAAIPGGIPPALLGEAFDSLRHRMLDLRVLTSQQPLGEAVLALPGTLGVAELIETLKWPTTTGVLRELVMERIEQQEHVDFHGSLLSLIEWSQA
ncbi:MAG: hypothetical protein ACYTG0_35205, partial [Planctomycetota bacterium]